MPRTLFLLCGEPSGEVYAARVARAFRERHPEVPMEGIGSSRLESEGVRLLRDYGDISVMGFTGVEGGPNPSRPGDIISPISTGEYLKTRDDLTLRSIIAQGQPNFGMSPFGSAFGGPLDDEEIDAIVAYIRAWEENPPVELPPEIEISQDTVSLDASQIYADLCAQCHGPNGEGGIGPSFQDPLFKGTRSDEQIFDTINFGHEATAMIGWGDILSAEQIQNLVDLIRGFRSAEVKPTPKPSIPSFSADVMPILEAKCTVCHGTLGGWDATSYESVMNTGDNAPVAIPGDVDQRLLAQKIGSAFSRTAFRKNSLEEPRLTPLATTVQHAMDLGCRSVIVQTKVQDPDYAAEYHAYHGKLFADTDRYCKRLHFFAKTFPPNKDVLDAIDEATDADYLGLLTLRPVRVSPVGATILRPPRSGSHFLLSKDSFDVPLAGKTFKVEGTPFMQQDNAVGACAQASIWMALRTLRKREGLAAHDPAQITTSATRFLVRGRTLPNRDGLEISQMMEAVRSAGYSPTLLSFREPNSRPSRELLPKIKT